MGRQWLVYTFDWAPNMCFDLTETAMPSFSGHQSKKRNCVPNRLDYMYNEYMCTTKKNPQYFYLRYERGKLHTMHSQVQWQVHDKTIRRGPWTLAISHFKLLPSTDSNFRVHWITPKWLSPIYKVKGNLLYVLLVPIICYSDLFIMFQCSVTATV